MRPRTELRTFMNEKYDELVKVESFGYAMDIRDFVQCIYNNVDLGYEPCNEYSANDLHFRMYESARAFLKEKGYCSPCLNGMYINIEKAKSSLYIGIVEQRTRLRASAIKTRLDQLKVVGLSQWSDEYAQLCIPGVCGYTEDEDISKAIVIKDGGFEVRDDIDEKALLELMCQPAKKILIA